MKRIILMVVVVGAVGAGIYLATHHQDGSEEKTADATAKPAEEVAQPATPKPAPIIPVHIQKTPVAASENAPPVAETKTNAADLVQQTVDFLSSTNTTFEEKQKMWAQLQERGEIDQVIAELRQRTTADPNDAEYKALLGQAMLKAISTNSDFSTRGILALGADQNFDDALKIDPDNWEARYYKAASMAHWPADLNKGGEVIEQFTTLIQQQEKLPSQPQYVRPYILLGDQYQKAGDMDSARQVWQRGIAFFPGDPALTKRLTGQQ